MELVQTFNAEVLIRLSAGLAIVHLLAYNANTSILCNLFHTVIHSVRSQTTDFEGQNEQHHQNGHQSNQDVQAHRSER